MSTRTIYFNGKSFDELGLIITKTVVPPVSHKKYKTVSIPDGGVIFEDTGVLDPIVFPINCTLTEPGKLREIYSIAAKPGILILPDEPDKYYYGMLTIATPQNIILHWNRITFTMTAEPYAYAVNNPDVVPVPETEGDHKIFRLNNLGTADCEPWYRFKAAAEGELKVWLEDEAKAVKIPVKANDEVSIDVMRNNVKIGASHVEYKIEGDYLALKLKPGQNIIRTRNCSDLIITFNERWY